MDILSKHKKKGLQGFQEFIYYLELAESKRVQDIMAIAWLEDPVYAQYLEPNMANFDFFLKKLNEDDYSKIFKALPNAPMTFTFALKDTVEREEFTKKLHPLLLRRVVETEQITLQISPLQRHEARNSLIKKMRELQEHNEITLFPWKIPNEKVLKGEHFTLPSNGRFQLKFENGTLALDGGCEKKLRAGAWTHFHPNGKIFAKGHYSEGEKFGHWSFFDLEGKPIADGNYAENLRAGEWKIVDKGVEKIVRYERGRIVA